MSVYLNPKLQFFTFLYSQFEDGMVVFSHPGIAQAGIWTYHAKLYPNTGSLSTTKMTVDVVSQSNNAEAEPFMLEVFSNEQGKSGWAMLKIQFSIQFSKNNIVLLKHF